MTKDRIEQKIRELKADYIRLQEDADKMASYGKDTSRTDKVLARIEKELKDLRNQLEELTDRMEQQNE